MNLEDSLNPSTSFKPSYHQERALEIIHNSIESGADDDPILEQHTWRDYFHITKEVFPFMAATTIRSRYLSDRSDIHRQLQHN
jgi:hypothetical protein